MLAGRRHDPWAILALVLAGAMLHLPRLAKPFGIADVNGGAYFGLFAKTWRDFGFLELRGLPLGPQRLVAPDQGGIPYLNHPPGVAWLCAALGTDEWCFRLPTAIAATMAAVALFLLLRGALGRLGAWLAALTLLGSPSAALYSQASYETIVLACGLCLWVATLRARDGGGTGSRTLQAGLAFVGPWMDWSFVFLCLGLVPLTASRSVKVWARRLLVPAAAASAAALLIVAWRVWALRCPLLEQASLPDTSLAELVRSTILERPPLRDGLTRSAATLTAAAGVPLAVAALLGAPLLGLRAPRLLLAVLLAGVSQPLTFAQHATDHVHFYCYTTMLLAAAASGLTALSLRPLRACGAAALGLACTLTWLAAGQSLRHSDTDFQRELGAVLAAATRVEGRRLPVPVVTNFHATYPYYVDSPYVLIGAGPRVVAVLELERRDPRLPYGYRFLWLADVAGASASSLVDPALGPILDPWPKTRLPRLERSLADPWLGFVLDIRTACIVDVEPRFTVVLAHAAAEAGQALAIAGALSRQRTIVFADSATLPLATTVSEGAEQLARATHVAVLWSSAAASEPAPLLAALRALLDQERPVVVAALDATPLAPPLLALADHEQVGVAAAPGDAAAVAAAIAAAFEDIVARAMQRVDKRRKA